MAVNSSSVAIAVELPPEITRSSDTRGNSLCGQSGESEGVVDHDRTLAQRCLEAESLSFIGSTRHASPECRGTGQQSCPNGAQPLEHKTQFAQLGLERAYERGILWS